MDLSKEDILRYSRQTNLPNFGLEGQKKLKNSAVLVIGCGGLGIPVLQYLCAAGVGTLGFIDFDTVDISNLQRQVIYNEEDIGLFKVDIVLKKLKKTNYGVKLKAYKEHLSSSNALELFKSYDIIIDASDNIPTRYLINDACLLIDKPFIYASIYQYEGHISVFNLKSKTDKSPNYRDIYPEPPLPELVPNCAEGGVIGFLPSLIGSIQGLEAIKIILFGESVLNGQMLIVDAMNLSFRKIKVKHKAENDSVRLLEDYEAYCMNSNSIQNDIDALILQSWMNEPETPILIDVREEKEREAGHIGGLWLPLQKLEKSVHLIPENKNIIFYCKSGQRSAKAVKIASKFFSKDKLYNLKGGLLNWKQTVDPHLTVI